MQLPALYRPILRRALTIVWKHKFLWFFGFWAALLGGSGEADILAGGINNINWGASASSIWGQVSKNKGFLEFLIGLGSRLDRVPGTGIAILALFLGVLIILVGLNIISQIILIISAARYGQGFLGTGEGELKTEASGFKKAKKYFWKVLSLDIISRALILGLLVLAGMPIFFISWGNLKMRASLIVLVIVFYIIFMSLALIVSFTRRYANCFVILGGEKIGKAISAGLKLFFRNWLVTIEAAGIIFGLNILVGLFMGFLSLAVAFPFIVGTETFINLGSGTRAFVAMTSGSVVILGILMIFGAVFVCFVQTAWTLLFLRLQSKEKQLSRLVRWVAMIGR